MSEGDARGETFDELVERLEGDLENALETRLRAALAGRDPQWLVDELVRRALRERHASEASGRQLARHDRHVEPLAERRRRLDRIARMGLDPTTLRDLLDRYRKLDRERLIAEGYLVDPPHKGLAALGPEQRSTAGETLLRQTHDLFYALLFCDDRQGARLPRERRDFLTVTLPVAKAGSLERFMLAVTEIQVAGTWLDPEGVSDDIEARNTVLQVEFGDSADGQVADALIVVLRLINDLEVNEEILYARIEELERSTLVQ